MSERNKIIFVKIAIPIAVLLGAILINRIMSASIDDLVVSPQKYGAYGGILNVFRDFTII